MPIKRPIPVEISPTFDTIENTIGSEADKVLKRAQNVNTLGEIPDSSWFTNRIGIRDMSIEELVRGGDPTGGPDESGPLVVVQAGLRAATPGLVVRDRRGYLYYLTFDRTGYPNLATGAAVITSKFHYAFGYHVASANIVHVDPDRFEIAPNAFVRMMGFKEKPIDKEFIRVFLDEKEQLPDGRYRAAAHLVPDADVLGPFKFYGTRPDDANDIFKHENHRELRGLRVFSAWLNNYLCRSISTVDLYVTENGRSYVRHYLGDFPGALGVGLDLEDRIVPKDKRASNEYSITHDYWAVTKTALSLGIWERPWMQVKYPYPKFAEIGRIEADFFQPDEWKPDYPNPAFERMFADDAFWATKIIARFSEEAIRAIVKTAQYADPVAEEYLVQTVMKRRDKIINYYFSLLNPLDHFIVENDQLTFRNLGEDHGLAQDSTYEYHWFTFNNESLETIPLGEKNYAEEASLLIPRSQAKYLMLRLRTFNKNVGGWKKHIEVYLREKNDRRMIIGIEREVGLPALDLWGRPTGETQSMVEFGGKYENLELDQQRLTDDWVARFNRAVKKQYTPKEFYDNLPISTRSTFEDATHALMNTELTDQNGNPMGPAIQIIHRLDRVHGRIKGAGGDEQFRIYIQLKPNALEILEKSREFKRGPDNTIYHKGYPLNYRHQVSPPSLQVSCAEDGVRADIDVDYKSSKFPAFLINGHLTAGNSDVRSGNNYHLHLNHWQGFMNWWRGLFGIPFIEDLFDSDKAGEYTIPLIPREGKGKLENAVYDFLTLWLEKQKPQLALAYMSEQAYHCVPVGEDMESDPVMARFILMDRMRDFNGQLGRSYKPEDLCQGVRLTIPRLKVITQRYHPWFVLYDVPDDIALQYLCSAQDQLEASKKSKDPHGYGKYFASVLRLRTDETHGDTMAVLWAKEGKYWKIVSYHVDPDPKAAPQIDLPPVETVALPRVAGNAAFIAENQAFLKAWLIDDDFDQAMKRFAPEAFDCVKLYASEEGEPTITLEESRKRLRAGMERIAEFAHKAPSLNDVFEGIDPSHPDLKIVIHDHEKAFTLVSVPDHMADEVDCDTSLTTIVWTEPETKVYGNYYATAFFLDLLGNDPAVLYLLWARRDRNWRIISYHVVTH